MEEGNTRRRIRKGRHLEGRTKEGSPLYKKRLEVLSHTILGVFEDREPLRVHKAAFGYDSQ